MPGNLAAGGTRQRPRGTRLHRRAGGRSFVGTSGYSYRHWMGGFYPRGLHVAEQLDHYMAHFDAVELNTTFYAPPSPSTVDSWRERAARLGRDPPFVFCLKADQFFTHRKQLIVDEVFTKRWASFLALCLRLGRHLGCILWQFPASFRLTKGTAVAGKSVPTLQRLRDLGELLRGSGCRFAFEFRHRSWYDDPEVLTVLRQYNWCLCILTCYNDTGWMDGMPSGSTPAPEKYPFTCDWGVYCRFHGTSGQYVGGYGARTMRHFALKLRKMLYGTARDAYAFFNNTDDGSPEPSAVVDARLLRQALAGARR